jgi:hypothetical protein
MFIRLTVDVSPKELTAFRMAPEIMEALREIKAREGIPVAVQIDFAIRDWLKAKGITLKSERKRVAARKRP